MNTAFVSFLRFVTGLAFVGVQTTVLHAAENRLFWEIGKADGNNAEFALAPGGFAKYSADAFYVVGRSTPQVNWPYVQPGPGDDWAGGREHVFTIVFGVKGAVAEGTCRLLVDLLDTHSTSPPKLHITGERPGL